jgi:hypothetical protein
VDIGKGGKGIRINENGLLVLKSYPVSIRMNLGNMLSERDKHKSLHGV